MIVGIAGLGLIGGSLAKAYKSAEGHTVYGLDKDEATLGFAQVAGAIDGVLDEHTLGRCDLLLIALYPRDAITYLRTMAPLIPKDTLVIDCCGVKRGICENGFAIARQYGFTFVGGHPMAGTQNSGFKHSRATLFKGAAMVLVPHVTDDILLYDRIEKALSPIGFGHLTITSAIKHDEMIAFTSQLAHVVSNAFIKSPTAREHRGYSAGSYKDLTRVAWLNPDMWADLFLENRDDLIRELDILMASLSQYRNALERNDFTTLRALLDDGRRIKEELDR